ncbi:MAG: DUF1559 domain-containing protein [Planctomycetota bacterium]
MKKTINSLRGIGTAMCLVLAFVVSPASLLAQSTDHVPESAFAALVVRPKAAFDEEAFDLLPSEIIKAFGDKELGVDLMDLRQVTMLVNTFDDTRNPPDFGVMFEFDSPQTLGGRVVEQLEPMEVAGLQGYLVEDRELQLVVVPFDEKTMVFGSTPMVTSMLSASGSETNLTAMMSGADASDHVGVFVSVEDIRQVINDNLPPTEMMSPQEKRFRKLPDLVRTVQMRQSLTRGGISEIRISSNNEQDLRKLDFLLRSGIDLIKDELMREGGFTGETEWGGFGDPDYDAAMLAYGDRMAGLVKDMIKADGEELVVDLNEFPGVQGISTFAVLGGMTSMFSVARAIDMQPGVAVEGMALAAPMAVVDNELPSTNQMRMIMLAMLNYESAYTKMPAQAIFDEDGNPLLSWRVAILPFIEELELYEEFHLDEPWDSEHNIQLLDRMPRIYASPIADLGNNTVFLAVKGESMFVDGTPTGVTFGQVMDGSSNTIALVEADPVAAVPWTKPQDLEVDLEDPANNLGDLYGGGFNAAFMDGSTRFINMTIDAETLKMLFLTNDGGIPDLDR